jgi:hypothetical protein
MIASSEMSFPSLRSAHVFSDEVGSSHAKATTKDSVGRCHCGAGCSPWDSSRRAG